MEKKRKAVPFSASAPSVPERTRPMEAVQEENAFSSSATLALPQSTSRPKVLLPSALDTIESDDSSSEPKEPKPSKTEVAPDESYPFQGLYKDEADEAMTSKTVQPERPDRARLDRIQPDESLNIVRIRQNSSHNSTFSNSGQVKESIIFNENVSAEEEVKVEKLVNHSQKCFFKELTKQTKHFRTSVYFKPRDHEGNAMMEITTQVNSKIIKRIKRDENTEVCKVQVKSQVWDSNSRERLDDSNISPPTMHVKGGSVRYTQVLVPCDRLKNEMVRIVLMVEFSIASTFGFQCFNEQEFIRIDCQSRATCN